LGIDIGVDPSTAMLLFAKRRGIQTLRAVGEHLPFRGRCFDYVLLAGTLCFLDNPAMTLKEAQDVLKADGSLIVCEVPKDSVWGKAIEEKGKKGHRFYSRAKLHTVQELHRLLEDARFRLVDSIGTLSFSPLELERAEDPTYSLEGMSFVCLRAKVRRSSLH